MVDVYIFSKIVIQLKTGNKNMDIQNALKVAEDIVQTEFYDFLYLLKKRLKIIELKS